ncbi:MAG: hypothetical protein RL648_123 [Verrucomicrobiota bacterium]|jgi:LysM repeat protein
MESWRKVKIPCHWIRVFLAISLLAMAGGCGPTPTVVKETEERSYRRGKSLLREGRQEEALQAFLSVVAARPDAIESHLESGLIYLNQIKDPLAAIYHFRSYLAMAPDGEHAGFVRELILTAQRDFAKTLPGDPFVDAVERVNLMETVKTLQAENNALKREVMDLEADLGRLRAKGSPTGTGSVVQRGGEPVAVAPIVIAPVAEEQAAARATTYTVQPGDTLSRISAKVYGESGRWGVIFEANRDQLPSPNALKPGQVLRIP